MVPATSTEKHAAVKGLLKSASTKVILKIKVAPFLWPIVYVYICTCLDTHYKIVRKFACNNSRTNFGFYTVQTLILKYIYDLHGSQDY